MNDHMRYGMLGILFTMMGMMVCLKSYHYDGWQEGILGLSSIAAGMYYFFLMGKKDKKD